MYATYSQKILKSMTCININQNINTKMYGERERKEMMQNAKIYGCCIIAIFLIEFEITLKNICGNPDPPLF